MDKYLEYLNKQFKERQASLALALAEGAAKSFEEYKQLVGEIRGLSFAQLCVNDLVRKLENDDDEN
jgi:hypothetical protein|tara:strand:+ start:828 stop:1025 length:198 start_codon:yes stop_codon:yes gene_type:complete